MKPPHFSRNQIRINNSHLFSIPIADPYGNEPQRKRFCFCLRARRKPVQFHPDRRLKLHIPDLDLPNNQISTSKYNFLTFVPVNLLEQFSKPANFYFLIIGGLQIIPAITNTDSQPTIYLPLFVIILISMVKDLFEDLKRHRADSEENRKQVLRLTDRCFENAAWQSLSCGDIIKVNQGEYFPADLLLLQTSEPKGMCFIETKNLDGETNLKHKVAHKEIANEFIELVSIEDHVRGIDWFYGNNG